MFINPSNFIIQYSLFNIPYFHPKAVSPALIRTPKCVTQPGPNSHSVAGKKNPSL